MNQNLRTNRFSQRWIFVKDSSEEGCYLIKSLRSGLCLDIKGESKKEGEYIIQWYENKGNNQKWKLENYGDSTYLIKSVMDPTLMLSIKGNQLQA